MFYIILGVFRAKTAVTSGSEDKAFLDLAVAKKGKDTIKYRLKDAANATVGIYLITCKIIPLFH